MNTSTLLKPKHRATSRGMTLVEILVVITIIVVLAALTTVGVTRIRSAARGATCTSNLRQLGAAMISYATDKNGQLPPLHDFNGENDRFQGIWPANIADGGYLPRVRDKSGNMSTGAGVWACPDCTVVDGNYNGYGVAEGSVMNNAYSSRPGSGSMRISAIPRPERTWLVGDALQRPGNLKTGWYAIWANPADWASSSGPAARHGGKVNVCMVDGHVESLTMKELRSPGKNYTMFR